MDGNFRSDAMQTAPPPSGTRHLRHGTAARRDHPGAPNVIHAVAYLFCPACPARGRGAGRAPNDNDGTSLSLGRQRWSIVVVSVGGGRRRPRLTPRVWPALTVPSSRP